MPAEEPAGGGGRAHGADVGGVGGHRCDSVGNRRGPRPSTPAPRGDLEETGGGKGSPDVQEPNPRDITRLSCDTHPCPPDLGLRAGRQRRPEKLLLRGSNEPHAAEAGRVRCHLEMVQPSDSPGTRVHPEPLVGGSPSAALGAWVLASGGEQHSCAPNPAPRNTQRAIVNHGFLVSARRHLGRLHT